MAACPAGTRAVRISMISSRSRGCTVAWPGVSPRTCSSDDDLEFCGLRFRPEVFIPDGSGEAPPDGRGLEIQACYGSAGYHGPVDVWSLERELRKRRLASGTCLGDRPEGEWAFQTSGMAKAVHFYIRGSPVIEAHLTQEGRLCQLGGLLEGKPHGTWKRWARSGELELVIEYDRGKMIRSTPYPDRALPASGP